MGKESYDEVVTTTYTGELQLLHSGFDESYKPVSYTSPGLMM